MTSISRELDPRYLRILEPPVQAWSQALKAHWLPILLALLALPVMGATLALLADGKLVHLLLVLILAVALLLAVSLTACLRLLRRQAHDLARLKAEAEQQALETDSLRRRDKVKANLLCVLAHDLRSPFASLKNMLWLLEQSLLEPSETASLLPSMRRQLDGLYGSLENLLIWSKQQACDQPRSAEPVAVGTLVHEVLALYQPVAQQKLVSLSAQGTGTDLVTGEADALRLILRNLLDNAVKFTPSGGSIVVSIANGPDGLSLQVRDTGLGMSPDQLGRLFASEGAQVRRGTQGEKGLGLGLQLCSRYAESCGGQLQASSQPGQGTCFELSLPACEPIQTVAPALV